MTTLTNETRGGRTSALCAGGLFRVYGWTTNDAVRGLLRRLVLRLEGGPVYSLTIREMFRQFHGVDVGLFTIGPCEEEPGNYPRGTRVGRYCSLYWTCKAIAPDDPAPCPGLPAWLYSSGQPEPKQAAPASPGLVIGHDVFVGHNAIIMPTVHEIGTGAFVGAGSVLHADVPPYAVVTGNPARVVRYRFSKERIQELLASQWWVKSIDQLSGEMEKFQRPVEGETIR